jgi:hypothetical protein
MDAIIWIILAAALFLMTGRLACFGVTLHHGTISRPSRSFPNHRHVSNEAEHKMKPASANLPTPGSVALFSSVLQCRETAQSQS